jgi:hypothetical protein
MKTTLTLKQIKEILNNHGTISIEQECHSWGCVTPHYREVLNATPQELYSTFERHCKNEFSKKIKKGPTSGR